jgi:hypothetical protein
VIVLTGPGRSGTSLLALLYRELGFDPGGHWNADARAGLEDRRCVDLNQAVLDGMGTSPNGRRGDVPPAVRSTLRRVLPQGLRQKARQRFRDHTPQRTLPPVRWSRVPAIVEELGPQLRAYAGDTAVVKDPRFCFTLGVWLASGARIDHVVVTVRDSAASASSRVAADLSKFADDDLMRTSTVLGLGALFDVLLNAEVPHRVLRFPTWPADVDALTTLPFPGPVPVPAERVRAAVEQVFEPSLVRHS